VIIPDEPAELQAGNIKGKAFTIYVDGEGVDQIAGNGHFDQLAVLSVRWGTISPKMCPRNPRELIHVEAVDVCAGSGGSQWIARFTISSGQCFFSRVLADSFAFLTAWPDRRHASGPSAMFGGRSKICASQSTFISKVVGNPFLMRKPTRCGI